MNLFELTVNDTEKIALNDLFFSAANKAALAQTIKEHHYLAELKKYDLKADHKILLYGLRDVEKPRLPKPLQLL